MIRPASIHVLCVYRAPLYIKNCISMYILYGDCIAKFCHFSLKHDFFCFIYIIVIFYKHSEPIFCWFDCFFFLSIFSLFLLFLPFLLSFSFFFFYLCVLILYVCKMFFMILLETRYLFLKMIATTTTTTTTHVSKRRRRRKTVQCEL